MPGLQIWSAHLCRVPVRAAGGAALTVRHFSASCQRKQQITASSSAQAEENHKNDRPHEEEKEGGAMARRLSQMTEDAILEGGRSARRNIEHAGFSEDLKRQLEERVKAASFKSEYAAAHSILDMPVCSCKPTKSSSKLISLSRIYSPAPAKERARQPQPQHGQAQNPSTTQPSACSMTPANQSEPPSRSPNP